MEKQKPTWSEKINARLQEAPGEIFKRGKWRFWFPLVSGLTALSGCLTAWIFRGAGVDVWIGIAVATLGGLMGWLYVGNLHYSDSGDAGLARGVSFLDSIALLFALAHLCLLLWAYGRLITLRGADAKYEVVALAYNEKLKNISTDNTKIAESARQIAELTVKAERLRNDTAYQQRVAAEKGLRVRGARSQGSGQFPALATAPIELERPKAPEESATAFLTKWDAWIRFANFGELILAAVTLIYIRNRSAKFNARISPKSSVGAFFPVATLSDRRPVASPALRADSAQKTTSVATGWREGALLTLREHLSVIAEGMPNHHFKTDLREPSKGGGVWIRLSESRAGRERIVAKTKQSDKLLAAVGRPDFRARLITELKACGFPIGKGGE